MPSAKRGSIRRRRHQSIRRISGLQRLLGIRRLLSLLVVERGAGDRGVGIVRGVLRHGQWRRLLSQSRAAGGRRPADARPDHVPGGGLVKKGLHLRIQVHNKKNVVLDIPAGIDTGMNLHLGGQGVEGEWMTTRTSTGLIT